MAQLKELQAVSKSQDHLLDLGITNSPVVSIFMQVFSIFLR